MAQLKYQEMEQRDKMIAEVKQKIAEEKDEQQLKMLNDQLKLLEIDNDELKHSFHI